MRRFLASASVLAGLLPSAAPAQDLTDWFVQTRFLGSLSSAPGDFATLPPGAAGGDQTSYQPQEYFGAGVGLGYQFSAWGIPFRAVLDGSMNFRHDTDVAALPAGTPNYHGNLETIDLRLSLLADVLDLGWGRFYVGGGLGAARVRTEVGFEHTPMWVENEEWKVSPSLEAGLAFTGFSRRVIPHIGYRFRWIGDVESGTFPTGERLRYSDFNIHDFIFGFTVPLAAADTAFASDPFPGEQPLADIAASGEAFWTGFHVGAFGGWGVADDFDVSGLATYPGGAPYYAANSYGLQNDGLFAGGEIGVDWQWRWLVLGLSGEAGILNLEGSADDPAATGGDTTTSYSSDWYGGISVRGGLAYQRFLAYGRVGVMYLNAEAETVDDCTLAPCGPGTASASEEDVLFGWFLGAGAEYAVNRHWSIGAEYRYMHLNDDLQPEGPSTIGTVAQEVSSNPIHAARASIQYRW